MALLYGLLGRRKSSQTIFRQLAGRDAKQGKDSQKKGATWPGGVDRETWMSRQVRKARKRYAWRHTKRGNGDPNQ